MTEGDSPLRHRLPARRDGRTRKLDYLPPSASASEIQRIYVTANYDAEPGAAPRVLECFLKARRAKTGTAQSWLLDDLGALISDELQHARTPRGLRNFLSAPDHDGQPVSLIAAILDTLIAVQDELVRDWHAAQKATP